MGWTKQIKQIKRAKKRGLLFSLLLVCLLCSGCGGIGNNGRGTQDSPGHKAASVNEDGTEQESGADMLKNSVLPPIPTSKEEEEELFGKTTPSGQWIPPEGSHKTPDGNIYNKEGLAIGSWRKPTKEEIADAVG